jgi:hypothetical protein
MNKVDFMELLKNNGLADFFDWLKYTKFISYGVIVEVVDAQTVRVAEVVKSGVSDNNHLATLLVPSSTLLEVAVLPKQGEPVLLFFTQKYHRSMFNLHRKAADAVIYDAGAEGYNSRAAVAVLLSPLKMNSSTALLFGGTAERPEASLTTMADWFAQFKGAMFLAFDGEGEEEAPVSVITGKKRPFTEDHRGTTRREYGFVADTVEKTLMETDAAVDEAYSIYAPITRNIQGAQTTQVGIGTDPGGDPDGQPVETEAPVTEVIHGKSPVHKDIRSPQTYRIGIGNTESGDAAEPREAPVNAELGKKAPITLTSASSATLHFDKPVSIDGKETYDLAFDGKVTVSSGAQITIAAGAKIYLGNNAVDLYTLLIELVNQVENLVTFGHPGIHKVTEASKTALELYKAAYIEPLLTANE